MFGTVPLSIIRSLALYTQQEVKVIQVMLTTCERDQAGSVLIPLASNQQTCMTYIIAVCVYGEKLLMMDRGTVRNM